MHRKYINPFALPMWKKQVCWAHQIKNQRIGIRKEYRKLIKGHYAIPNKLSNWLSNYMHDNLLPRWYIFATYFSVAGNYFTWARENDPYFTTLPHITGRLVGDRKYRYLEGIYRSEETPLGFIVNRANSNSYPDINGITLGNVKERLCCEEDIYCIDGTVWADITTVVLK